MAESSLFRSIAPHQPTDLLLLVENSQQMSLIWDDLRDRYLSPLMARLQMANEPVPPHTTVWVLESQPLQTSSPNPLPRQYHDPQAALHDVRLNYLPENRLSYSKVDEAANFLSSLRAANEGRSLHLIVVAASSPDVDPSTLSTLARKLSLASIFCHTLTKSTTTEDMTALTALFEETLRAQSNMEDLVSFPVDANYSIRLSMSPEPGQFNSPPRPQRIPMPPRRNTFPLETSHFDPAQESSLSLVTHLQQVHGLTKKKVYGAKPSRQPFIKDERIGEHHHHLQHQQISLPLNVTSHDSPIAPSSGRALSHSKADRLARLSQASSPTTTSAAAVTTDSQGRGYMNWVRRGSRVSSPEEVGPGVLSPIVGSGGFSDMSPPPGTTTNSYISSPISPTSVDDYYSSSAGALVSGGSPDPTWLQSVAAAQGYYMAQAPPPPPLPPGPGGGGGGYAMYSNHPPDFALQMPGIPGTMIVPSQTSSSSTPTISSSSSSSSTSSSSSQPTTIPPPPPPLPLPNSRKDDMMRKSFLKTITPSPPLAPAPITPASSAMPVGAGRGVNKKVKPNRPEDHEFIELDHAFVQTSTDLFNEYFPNTENFPDSNTSVGGVKKGAAAGNASANVTQGGSATTTAATTTTRASPASGTSAKSSPANIALGTHSSGSPSGSASVGVKNGVQASSSSSASTSTIIPPPSRSPSTNGGGSAAAAGVVGKGGKSKAGSSSSLIASGGIKKGGKRKNSVSTRGSGFYSKANGKGGVVVPPPPPPQPLHQHLHRQSPGSLDSLIGAGVGSASVSGGISANSPTSASNSDLSSGPGVGMYGAGAMPGPGSYGLVQSPGPSPFSVQGHAAAAAQHQQQHFLQQQQFQQQIHHQQQQLQQHQHQQYIQSQAHYQQQFEEYHLHQQQQQHRLAAAEYGLSVHPAGPLPLQLQSPQGPGGGGVAGGGVGGGGGGYYAAGPMGPPPGVPPPGVPVGPGYGPPGAGNTSSSLTGWAG